MTRRFAVFSPCGNYRYWLRRELGSGSGRALWIMMNPSRAGADRNDATTTLTSNLSRAHGFAEHAQVNLSAQIEPDSTQLNTCSGASDPLNLRAIMAGLRWVDCEPGGQVIIAWGANKHLKQNEAKVLRLLKGRPLLCLGQTQDGSPRFPRGIRRDAKLIAFKP